MQGNHIVNAAGSVVVLRGVNQSGPQIHCLGRSTIFGVAMGPASIPVMKSWMINVVRLPLNEDCWLGLNGMTLSGAAYQQQVVSYAHALSAAGIAVILDLHFSAPGSMKSTTQMPMADADHSVAFWTSVATTFKGDNSVLFDLYNEPHPLIGATTDANFK